MQINFYDIDILRKKLKNKVPNDSHEWVQFWNGKYCLKESFSKNATQAFSKLIKTDIYSSHVLEIFTILTLIENWDKEEISFMEFGSGRAPWCLTLASCVDDMYINTKIKNYKILALEAEPTHYKWTEKHLQKQVKNHITLEGAIWSSKTKLNFDNDGDPAGWMGQNINKNGITEVQTYTIDDLILENNFKEVDIIHMDVQEAEVEAIKGAKNSINNGKINYFLIATHNSNIEYQLKELLLNDFDLIIELKQHEQKQFDCIDKPFYASDDGFFVFKKKAI